MAFAFDVTTINFIFGILIFLMGLWVWKKGKAMAPLYIGIAFLLFALTHLVSILEYSLPDMASMALRVIAYLLVLFSLYKMMAKK